MHWVFHNYPLEFLNQLTGCTGARRHRPEPSFAPSQSAKITPLSLWRSRVACNLGWAAHVFENIFSYHFRHSLVANAATISELLPYRIWRNSGYLIRPEG